MFMLVERISTRRNFFLGTLFILILLLFRDPFSERTLVANLEPYPDTFHYIVPARNFALGNGFSFSRGFGDLDLSVPPLYSFVLLPFYLITPAVQVYYFANVALTIAGFYFFYLALSFVTKNKWALAVGLLLYATSFYISWYPEWAMAETLVLFLFNSALYLLTRKSSLRKFVGIGIVSALFYTTKYAYLPVALAFPFIAVFGILLLKNKKKLQFVSLLAFSFILIFGLTVLYQSQYSKISDLYSSIGRIAQSIFPTGKETTSTYSSQVFSQSNFQINIKEYGKFLLGKPIRVLWDTTPVFPQWVMLVGFSGLLLSVFSKKNRIFALSAIVSVLFQLFFIATFYAVDGRYLLHVIPVVVLGFTFALDKILSEKIKVEYLRVALVILLVSFYLFPMVPRIRMQLAVNLKYAETPWSYVAIKQVSNYFTENYTGSENPVVISAQAPFLFDFYAPGQMYILPLSKDQDFRRNRHLVWGPGNYDNLIALYQNYVDQGRDVFVSSYGQGNVEYLHASFAEIAHNFNLQEVYSGCFEQCRVYRLSEK